MMNYRTENLVAEDFPDVLLSLVLIGLDRTTSNELRANLHLAIDSICWTINTSTVSPHSQNPARHSYEHLVAPFHPSTTSQSRIYAYASQ
jgi:hypothetical protein